MHNGMEGAIIILIHRSIIKVKVMRSLFQSLMFGFLVSASMVAALVAYNLNGFEYDAAAEASESQQSQEAGSPEKHEPHREAKTILPVDQVLPPESGLRGEISSAEELVIPRATFMEALAAAKEALAEAEHLGDLESSHETLAEAEENVWDAKNNSGSVLFETDRVMRETGWLILMTSPLVDYLDPSMYVAEEDALTDTEGLQTLPSYHPARIALDAIGGTDIKLGSATSVCGPTNEAMACAYGNDVILLDDEYVNEDYDFLYHAMMHEYAHQVQFDYQLEMEASPGYSALFDSSYEWIADCMSASRIPGYLSGYMHGCSSEQLTYGENAWKGVFL